MANEMPTATLREMTDEALPMAESCAVVAVGRNGWTISTAVRCEMAISRESAVDMIAPSVAVNSSTPTTWPNADVCITALTIGAKADGRSGPSWSRATTPKTTPADWTSHPPAEDTVHATLSACWSFAA